MADGDIIILGGAEGGAQQETPAGGSGIFTPVWGGGASTAVVTSPTLSGSYCWEIDPPSGGAFDNYGIEAPISTLTSTSIYVVSFIYRWEEDVTTQWDDNISIAEFAVNIAPNGSRRLVMDEDEHLNIADKDDDAVLAGGGDFAVVKDVNYPILWLVDRKHARDALWIYEGGAWNKQVDVYDHGDYGDAILFGFGAITGKTRPTVGGKFYIDEAMIIDTPSLRSPASAKSYYMAASANGTDGEWNPGTGIEHDYTNVSEVPVSYVDDDFDSGDASPSDEHNSYEVTAISSSDDPLAVIVSGSGKAATGTPEVQTYIYDGTNPKEYDSPGLARATTGQPLLGQTVHNTYNSAPITKSVFNGLEAGAEIWDDASDTEDYELHQIGLEYVVQGTITTLPTDFPPLILHGAAGLVGTAVADATGARVVSGKFGAAFDPGYSEGFQRNVGQATISAEGSYHHPGYLAGAATMGAVGVVQKFGQVSIPAAAVIAPEGTKVAGVTSVVHEGVLGASDYTDNGVATAVTSLVGTSLAPGQAYLISTGVIASAGLIVVQGAAGLVSAAVTETAGLKILIGAGGMSAAATVAPDSQVVTMDVGDLVATAVLSPNSQVVTTAIADIIGAGVLYASGSRGYSVSGDIAAIAAIDASSTVVTTGQADLSGAAIVDPTATRISTDRGEAALVAAAAVTADSVVIKLGQVAVPATAVVEAAPTRISTDRGAAGIAAAATVDASGLVQVLGEVLVVSAATIEAVPTRISTDSGEADLAAAAVVDAEGTKISTDSGEASVAAAAQIGASGLVQVLGAAGVAAAAALDADSAGAVIDGVAALVATAQVSISSSVVIVGSVELAATAGLSLDTTVVTSGVSSIVGSAVMSAFFTFAGQIARPESDITQGSWTNNDNGAELYSYIDEAIPDDTDYIRSPTAPTGQTSEVKLATVTSPGEGSVAVRYRQGTGV